MSLVAHAGKMLDRYAEAMAATKALLDERFDQAVEAIVALDSILIVTGLGKSGDIGRKVAATLSSTGTPAAFVHPVEALHGDLGIVREGSVLLALSKSGGNAETIEFARQFKAVAHGPVISITEPGSRLAGVADIALDIPALPEIDQFDLAPTTSAVTTLAVCDVLAVVVQQSKGLTERDFARFHPSGALGKRLLLSVDDLMVKGDALPTIGEQESAAELVFEITSKGLGMVIVVDGDGRHRGVVTDADLRRLLLRGEHVSELSVAACLARSRRGEESLAPAEVHGATTPGTMAIDCLRQMQANEITELVVLVDGRPVGVVRLQDLIAAGF